MSSSLLLSRFLSLLLLPYLHGNRSPRVKSCLLAWNLAEPPTSCYDISDAGFEVVNVQPGYNAPLSSFWTFNGRESGPRASPPEMTNNRLSLLFLPFFPRSFLWSDGF